MHFDAIYIFWTCRDLDEGRLIARQLLQDRWIACASIWPAVESLYMWRGNLESNRECKVLFKTRRAHFDAIAAQIRAASSYQISEVVAVPLVCLDPSYAMWLFEQTENPESTA